jgi:hypothetical protein
MGLALEDGTRSGNAAGLYRKARKDRKDRKDRKASK